MHRIEIHVDPDSVRVRQQDALAEAVEVIPPFV